MTRPFRRGELFGDGAGGALALGLAMDTAAAHVNGVWIDHPCDLILRVDPSGGTAPDQVEFEVQDNPSTTDPAAAAPGVGLGADGWLTVPISYGIDDEGVRLQTAGVYRKNAGNVERFYVRIHHETWIRIRAMRVGGAVDTNLLVTGEVRDGDGLENPLGVPLASLRAPFFPFDNGYQALNIGAAAVLSAQLVAGETYHLKALAPCHFLAGDNAIVATANDYWMYAGETIEYDATDDNDYISVIRDTIDSANGFRISRAS